MENNMNKLDIWQKFKWDGITTCNGCGKLKPTITVASYRLCKDCFLTNYATCDMCGKETQLYEACRKWEGNYYEQVCGECYEIIFEESPLI